MSFDPTEALGIKLIEIIQKQSKDFSTKMLVFIMSIIRGKKSNVYQHDLIN